MRRSRYTGFYRTFTPRQTHPPEEPKPVAGVTYTQIHRELCLQWYPHTEFVRLADSKKRERLVYDASGTSGFPYQYPLGSPRAFVRVFWREDHVRETRLREDADRATDTATIKRQLRYSSRVDLPEHAARSTERAIQDLYDSRRGMGRR